jgi:hypothetical protein
MNCRRCHGLLVPVQFRRGGAWWARCVNCGERMDAALLQNRAEQAAELAWLHEGHEREMKEWISRFTRRPPITDPIGST